MRYKGYPTQPGRRHKPELLLDTLSEIRNLDEERYNQGYPYLTPYPFRSLISRRWRISVGGEVLKIPSVDDG